MGKKENLMKEYGLVAVKVGNHIESAGMHPRPGGGFYMKREVDYRMQIAERALAQCDQQVCIEARKALGLKPSTAQDL
jgi:hypothetical protein